MHNPSRGGVRGGKDQFEWDTVKTDKHRENYLGHSLMAPVGRWQKGKDLTWYTKDKEAKIKQQQTEKSKIKQLEEEAMMAALGFGTMKKRKSSLTKQEITETLKRGQTERDSGNVERVEGMGFGSSRAAMMDTNFSNEGFIKEPVNKVQDMKKKTISNVKYEDDKSDESVKKKTKKKHKTKKSKKSSKEEKRKNDNRRKYNSGSGSSDYQSDCNDKTKEITMHHSKRRKKSDNDNENKYTSSKKDHSREQRHEVRRRKPRHDSTSSNDNNSSFRSNHDNSRGKRRRDV
ncbi:multiple myeloma tumor-associated protein 2 homolog [Xenia sp. Carnegie-2017]|uniref:multiple myeloma tumor-associated protein 2 homolog n=1 Tax=Xenia sp. Carnegie-2017 TaxID=2897299 RepID=UPI001F04A482|nr:multiple myeloma tumor-associated protein 2 homolog [Xenia sp. Carnegie-2017]